ncbi:MAG: polyphosphate:AMP phosphotransferase [Myxococcales bacterium]|nr:MAG: polyphosphate:AMP phosphotransferase [Myxococcales bacterium]
MFELAEAGNRLEKDDYEKAAAELRPALLALEQKLREAKDMAVAVLIGGVEGAGKIETANLLMSWLDPRSVEVNAFGPDDESRGRPPFYRFWMHLPPKGKLGIFYGSWYTDPIVRFASGDMKKAQFAHELEKIRTFERHLAAERVLLVKFWLHLSKDAQKKRRKKLAKDPRKAWMLATPQEHRYFKLYDEFYAASEEALRVTSTAEAPWTVVEAADRRWREATVARTLLDAMSAAMEARPAAGPKPMAVPKKKPRTALDAIDLTRTVARAVYEKELEELQADIGRLAWEALERGVSTALVFEGWDAAGKGGAIRRLTQGLDARNYRVVPIGAPAEEERARPYLWRFWRHLPPSGRLTVFDRSWYGRVLVERVEGFCRPEDWKRAYSEINDFEAQLAANGTRLAKFWLHITPEEQVRRFEERRDTPHKRYKLTEDDWRNRRKWNAYLAALDEMFARTSTSIAPWTIVPAEDKLGGRLCVLRTYRDLLKSALKKSRKTRQAVVLD